MISPVPVPVSSPADPLRLGIVEFLNALPLRSGLDRCCDVEIVTDVPSRLIDHLVKGEVDVALCSTIDYQRAPVPLIMLPAPPLAASGETLTVRLFSRVPIDAITAVHCDIDSHTSVILMQLLMEDRLGYRPDVIPYDRQGCDTTCEPESMLLIGDKVVIDAPDDHLYCHQLDLGEEWRIRESLPFVFGAWMARQDADPLQIRRAQILLDWRYRYNALHLDQVLADEGARRKWPLELAKRYVTEMIQYEFGPWQIASLERFWARAAAGGFIEACRPLVLSGATSLR
jgi:chorismate dehydratase